MRTNHQTIAKNQAGNNIKALGKQNWHTVCIFNKFIATYIIYNYSFKRFH